MAYRFDVAPVVSAVPEENPAAVGWIDASRAQFHQPRSVRRTQELFLQGALESDWVLNGVWATGATRLQPEPDRRPVMTFCTFLGSVNVSGSDVLDALMITDVTVNPAHRRRGLLRTLMTQQLEKAHDQGLPLAALTATEGGIYERFGFGPASLTRKVSLDTTRPPVMRPHADHWGDPGRVESIDDRLIDEVLGEVFPKFHATTRGSVDRPPAHLRAIGSPWRQGDQHEDRHLQAIAHTGADGTLDGYALYSPVDEGRGHFGSTLQIRDLISLNPLAHLALWEYLVTVDLAPRVSWDMAPVEGPLRWAMNDQRAMSVTGEEDLLWLRILDPVTVLQARSWRGSGQVQLGLHDPLGHVSGTYRIVVEDGTAQVTKVSADAGQGEVRMEITSLSNAILGATSITMLSRAGRIAGDPEVTEQLALMMAVPTAPWCATYF